MFDNDDALWRDSADDSNPAGPMFAGGEYAASDVAGDGDNGTCSADTGSTRVNCC